jgi:hypothetical protein
MLGEEIITDLLRWRKETPYAKEQDWIFASGRMKGRQPLWPEAIMRNYICPAARRAGITKQIDWHVFNRDLAAQVILRCTNSAQESIANHPRRLIHVMLIK